METEEEQLRRISLTSGLSFAELERALRSLQAFFQEATVSTKYLTQELAYYTKNSKKKRRGKKWKGY